MVAAIRYELTDDERDAVECNMGLAYKTALKVVHRFRIRGQDEDDVAQEALLGLIRAVATCDAEKGALSTIAEQHVRQRIQRHRRARGVIHVPHYLDWKPDHKNSGAVARAKVSLDADLGGDFSLAWLSGDRPDDAVEAAESARYIALAVQRLPDRERDVVERRMRGETYKDIAVALGTSRGRVRDVERRAHADLREMLADHA